ncbi:MAG: hypothetical protein V4685_18415 [Bacteroidota bacterium]
MKQILLFLLPALFLITSSNLYSQELQSPSYNLDFVKAQYVDSTDPNEIILFFKYSTKEKKDFKLIASMKITYSIGENGEEITQILDESKNNHSIVVFGRDMKAKSPDLYSLIKNKVNFNDKQDFLIVVFYLRGLIYSYVDKMTFTYGLWEPSNTEKRFEKKYNINIDK